MNNCEANFQMLNYYISNSTFEVINNTIKNEKLNLNIQVNFSNLIEDENGIRAELILKNIINVTDNNDNLKVVINIEIRGVFNGKNMDDNTFMEYMKHSGTPVLSQYIRSYVSSISALSGIEIVNLPLINYVEFFKNAKITQNNNQ